jgi:hypothetical protein
VGLPLIGDRLAPHHLNQQPKSPAFEQGSRGLLEYIWGEAEAHRPLSREHFSCSDTLLEAAALLKTFRLKDEDGDSDGGPKGGNRRNPDVSSVPTTASGMTENIVLVRLRTLGTRQTLR